MKLFLISNDLNAKNEQKLKELLGMDKVNKTLFITAASVPYGDNPRPDWLLRSLNEMSKFTESYDETNLEDVSAIPISLNEYDFIFVSGGNIFYLAYRLKETGIDSLVKKYIQDGGLYIGSSAGALVLADDISPFKFADDPTVAPSMYPGLDILSNIIIPHVDNDHYAETMSQIHQVYKQKNRETVLLNDDQVYIVDGAKKIFLKHKKPVLVFLFLTFNKFRC